MVKQIVAGLLLLASTLGFARDPQPIKVLSQIALEHIDSKGGIVELNTQCCAVIYQSNEAWDKCGYLKNTLLNDIDTSKFNYKSQAGGDQTPFGVRFYLTKRFTGF